MDSFRVVVVYAMNKRIGEKVLKKVKRLVANQ